MPFHHLQTRKHSSHSNFSLKFTISILIIYAYCILMQWRTLRIIVGGAKSYYMTVEGANL
jgi:hypothetical protein